MLWDVLVPAPGESRPSYLGVHMPGVYPEHRLVLEHRADTQQAFEFSERDPLQIIRRVHGARRPRPE